MLVRNTGRYAFSFILTDEKGRDKNIEFDRRRIYRDTGNVATTGITEISEDVHKELLKQKAYAKLFETGDFAIVTEEELVPDNESKQLLKAKDDEIAELKKKLAEKKDSKTDDKETKKALEAKDKEIKSLKDKLNALGKGEEDKVTEGF